MEDYITASKAFLASTRLKILANFYHHMTSMQRYEVNSLLLLTLLLIYVCGQLPYTDTAAIIAMVIIILLSLYMTYSAIHRHFRQVYLQLYLDYGEKMELPGNIYIRYLAFIHQLRLHNLYMVDDLKKIIHLIDTELTSKHISYPMLNTLPMSFVTLLLGLLIGGLLYQYADVMAIKPFYLWIVVMAVLIFSTGWFAHYRKSIQLQTLRKFCAWAIIDIEFESDFDGIEEIF